MHHLLHVKYTKVFCFIPLCCCRPSWGSVLEAVSLHFCFKTPFFFLYSLSAIIPCWCFFCSSCHCLMFLKIVRRRGGNTPVKINRVIYLCRCNFHSMNLCLFKHIHTNTSTSVLCSIYICWKITWFYKFAKELRGQVLFEKLTTVYVLVKCIFLHRIWGLVTVNTEACN
jgi:hypothetical protein